MNELLDLMERRGAIQARLIQSLAHLDREHAMHTILAWISIKDLEEIAPTLSGNPEILRGLP